MARYLVSYFIYRPYFLDMRRGYCFDSLDNRGCSIPRMLNVTKSVCCCTKGAGWGDPCEICPAEQTGSLSCYIETLIMY